MPLLPPRAEVEGIRGQRQVAYRASRILGYFTTVYIIRGRIRPYGFSIFCVYHTSCPRTRDGSVIAWSLRGHFVFRVSKMEGGSRGQGQGRGAHLVVAEPFGRPFRGCAG